MTLERAAIERTYERIRPHIRVTPVLGVDGAEFGLPPCSLFLKLEQLQHAGSFKVRGAFANLLTREIPKAGVVAASGGNHGAAVAYAARLLQIPVRIFVPSIASRANVERIRAVGADLTIAGDRYADALAASQAWAQQAGAISIHAFDQLETLLGQATLGLELSTQCPDLDTVLVAVGGGGLIGGVAGWYAGRVRVIGVEPERAPTLTAALAAGRPVDAPAEGLAADSLAPRRVGELMFPIAQLYVDRVALVSDDAIRRAQMTLWERARIVAEPGGAAAFAALQSGAHAPRPNERVAVVVCGANTTAVEFAAPPPAAALSSSATSSLT